MDLIILSLGSNLGDRLENLKQARLELERQGVKVLKTSPVYETEPVGGSEQDYFLNQVLSVKTKRQPIKLLELCLAIEKSLGRERQKKYGPRTLDIDLLFYKNIITDDPKLTLPHPRLQERRFVLIPLEEIAGPEKHPLFGSSISDLLDDCEDEHIVEPLRKNS